MPSTLTGSIVLVLSSMAASTSAATLTSTAVAAPAAGALEWMAQGTYGGVLTMVANADPDPWDLHQSCCNPGPGAARDLFNTPVMYNPVKPAEIIGDLAQRWEVSPDGLSYTFYLHEVRWWDGQPVTAADAKFSLDRMLEPGKPRPRVGALRHCVERTEVIDAKTVKVYTRFATPAAFLPFLAIDSAVIYPKPVLERRVDLGLMLKQHLKPIGIEVELRIVDANALLTAQAQGDYATTGIRHGPSILDPDELFQAMYLPGGSRNQLNWEDPRLTALFEQQARELHQDRRRALVLQAEAIIRRGETAWMTLSWGADTGNMVNRKVKNDYKPLTVHTAMTHEHLGLGEAEPSGPGLRPVGATPDAASQRR